MRMRNKRRVSCSSVVRAWCGMQPHVFFFFFFFFFFCEKPATRTHVLLIIRQIKDDRAPETTTRHTHMYYVQSSMEAAGGGGGPPPAVTACAACKYQRRRCVADCPLAPYFPHDRSRVFRSAHRLFGVSNILKTLERAGPDPDRRHEAMQCVVYESQAWDLYPSAGCVPIIHGLQQRIHQVENELRRVRAHLQAYQQPQPRDIVDDAAAGVRYSSMPPSSPPPFQLQWTAAAMGEDDEGIAAAAAAARDDERQMMINDNAVTSDDDGNNMPPPPPPHTTLRWTLQPPQYEHPFFVNETSMVPQFQFHYQHHQPVVAVSTQLPELQEDDMTMVNYFADDDGINNGENDEMPRRQSR